MLRALHHGIKMKLLKQVSLFLLGLPSNNQTRNIDGSAVYEVGNHNLESELQPGRGWDNEKMLAPTEKKNLHGW